jgi:glyoxylase-like metal-dependent hydrolase (beta-lactamase superfamily II)
MQYEKINSYLIWTSEGYGNTTAINLGEKIFVIDSTLNWKLAQEWRETIEEYFDESISGLILTHHHEDHTFGNQVFSDLPIISSTEIRKIMVHQKKHLWILEDMMEAEEEGYGIKGLEITLPTICFENRLTIHGGRQLDVIRVDGHTLGSSYLWEEETRTLIAGDLVFNQEFPYGGDETSDLIRWKTVIDELIELKPKVIISGHGPPATENDLLEISKFFSKCIDFMKKKLREKYPLQQIIEDPQFPEYYSQDRIERKKVTVEKWYNFFEEKTS